MDDPTKSLYRMQINTWQGRQKGDPPPHTFSHPTEYGPLTLEPAYPGGILQCDLHLDGRRIASFTTPIDGAKAVAAGQFDEELGFSAKEVGTPSELRDWGRW